MRGKNRILKNTAPSRMKQGEMSGCTVREASMRCAERASAVGMYGTPEIRSGVMSWQRVDERGALFHDERSGLQVRHMPAVRNEENLRLYGAFP